MDSNHRPHAYQACALTRLSYRPLVCPSDRWWTRPGSNRRPPGCKPGALPAELRAHAFDTDTSVEGRFQSIAMLSHGSHSPFGSWRLDLLDANQALSQLSYGPEKKRTPKHARQSSTSVFKNRIDIAIGSVDLSSLVNPQRADARGGDSP